MTPRRDFERYAAIAALVLLVLGCYMVVRPFLTSFLWGSIIAVSTWGIYSRLLARLGQRRTLAAALTGFGLAMTLLVPIVALGLSLASQWPLVAEKVPQLEDPPGPLCGMTDTLKETGVALAVEDDHGAVVAVDKLNHVGL